MDRERFQLVIALGEGSEGQRLREVLDRAAERAGRPVSVWAREKILAAAGDSSSEGPIDPIVEVILLRRDTREGALLDLRAVLGMQNGWSNKVRALVGGEWIEIGTAKPDEFVEKWKRVRRWGLM